MSLPSPLASLCVKKEIHEMPVMKEEMQGSRWKRLRELGDSKVLQVGHWLMKGPDCRPLP